MNQAMMRIDDDVIEEARVDTAALAVSERADLDAQVATARAFPRSVSKSLSEALTLATMNETTAGSMFYALPRGKDSGGNAKFIEGPSARLAEVMLYSWGNIRCSSEVVATEHEFVVAEATCADIEKNVAVRVRVKRRITDKYGKRYNDDMIGVTGNAAVSIALRNAVFKIIPRSFVDRIYEAARSASIGEGTIESKRARALGWFAKLGKSPEAVMSLLGVRGEADIGEEELMRLRGIRNAIQEGTASVESIFAPIRVDSEATLGLNDAVKKEAAKAKSDDDKPKTKAKPAPKTEAPKAPQARVVPLTGSPEELKLLADMAGAPSEDEVDNIVDQAAERSVTEPIYDALEVLARRRKAELAKDDSLTWSDEAKAILESADVALKKI